ncbi:MAG TPA: hypothetical protein VNI61_10855 [Gemmatimonadales bacterium]|nr:hypothetical protein [Gemmatimonadales bacterium]
MDEDTSARAARKLIAAGYDPRRLAVVVGGIGALHRAGHPLKRWSEPA